MEHPHINKQGVMNPGSTLQDRFFFWVFACTVRSWCHFGTAAEYPRLGDMCMMRLGLGLEGMIAAHIRGPPDASGLDAGKKK